ncbi:cyclin-P1-1 [Hordeum vulgare subsp. vulgare]|uniref:Cyclin n=2 Tax=Hordeum vulgare subsp. vulgare TaxID=112509 RepID=A0A8I6XD29_HORVV|nr:cyclin-P1-1 [Hordeum vulgare subsp. vulgare]KAI5010711.1 hypothetical protein ZWY2020_012848 [Hordeum vulgare]
MGDVAVAVAAGGLSSPPTPTPPELNMVAHAVERLVARNDALLLLAHAEQGSGEGVTAMAAFEGTGPPRIGVAQYLERVHRYAALEPECYVVAYAYVDRAAHRRPAAAVASRNVHRLLLACLLVASKVLDDFHHDNAFFARVGGVSNAEMNKLELELLGVLDFEVMLSRRLYDLYRAHLHKQQADDHHDTSNKPDQEPLRVDGGEEDHDDDRITRLPDGVLRYDWSQQAPAANGARRHSSSQAPSRYS